MAHSMRGEEKNERDFHRLFALTSDTCDRKDKKNIIDTRREERSEARAEGEFIFYGNLMSIFIMTCYETKYYSFSDFFLFCNPQVFSSVVCRHTK